MSRGGAGTGGGAGPGRCPAVGSGGQDESLVAELSGSTGTWERGWEVPREAVFKLGHVCVRACV